MSQEKNSQFNYGSHSTDASNHVDHLEDETNVAIPTSDAVEDAKEWVEDHEM